MKPRWMNTIDTGQEERRFDADCGVQLVRAVLQFARHDVVCGEKERIREDARGFFESGEYRMYCDLIGLEPEIEYAKYERARDTGAWED